MLKVELLWIDDHIGDRPHGIDILISELRSIDAGLTGDAVVDRVPARHNDFVVDLLGRHDVAITRKETVRRSLIGQVEAVVGRPVAQGPEAGRGRKPEGP